MEKSLHPTEFELPYAPSPKPLSCRIVNAFKTVEGVGLKLEAPKRQLRSNEPFTRLLAKIL